VTIKHLAAGAAHHRAGLLRWQLFASCPHFIFARGPVALIAPCPKVSLGSVCQKYLPRGFEVGTGLVERGSGATLVFARMRPGIETAMPFPRILIMGIAAADRDPDIGGLVDWSFIWATSAAVCWSQTREKAVVNGD
jgi:hypothetical protein